MTLPNFIVIGAAKAGTTALYWYLAGHPDVFMSPMKETNFFAFGLGEDGRPLYGDPELHRFPVRTLSEYESLFAGAGGAAAIGEASPIYLECPQAAGRIRRVLPDARIVCGLRDPVDRAYSDYLMYRRSRRMRFDPQRELVADAPWARPDSHWMRIGMYHEMLMPYYDAFGHERIHVFLFDDLRRAPGDVARELYAFLEVDPGFRPDLETPHNIGGVPSNMAVERVLTSHALRRAVEPLVPTRAANWVRRVRTRNLQKAPPLPRELRAELLEVFRDDILKTSELVGRDLGAWLSPVGNRQELGA